MDTFLNDLMAHAEWANAIFFRAWEKSPALDNEEMRTRVGHIVGVQAGFMSIFSGEQPGGPPAGPPPTFAELKSRAEKSHANLRNFTSALNTEDRSRTVLVPWFPDPPCVITIEQALIQVAMHSQHHRGQCMTRLKDFGGQAKNIDWIIWLWKQKPEARWT
jgi:uncharacterized damage-inducible protein DinB